MEGVLGVWMAPTALRMVLVEGENADGVTVEEKNIERTAASGPATRSGPDQVISAILGTQERAAESGYQLRSTGVTWTYPGEAAALRDALANRKIENVTLVSAFLAAAALAQEVGDATGYRRTALLFVEPHSATLAVVDTADGSIVDVRGRLLRSPDLVAELVAIVSGAQGLHTRADGLFVVGSGVDVAPIKPALEAATSLAVSTPEEPETALARGGALASAHAPLFTSSTAAVAYARDPGIGAIGPYGVAPGHFDVPAGDLIPALIRLSRRIRRPWTIRDRPWLLLLQPPRLQPCRRSSRRCRSTARPGRRPNYRAMIAKAAGATAKVEATVAAQVKATVVVAAGRAINSHRPPNPLMDNPNRDRLKNVKARAQVAARLVGLS